MLYVNVNKTYIRRKKMHSRHTHTRSRWLVSTHCREAAEGTCRKALGIRILGRGTRAGGASTPAPPLLSREEVT